MDSLSPKILQQLQTWFGIGFKKGGKNKPSEIVPVKKVEIDDKEFKDKAKTLEKLPFDEKTKQAYDYWIRNTRTQEDTYKNMSDVYKDSDILYNNSPIINKAIEVTADEVIQADSNNQIIFVEAKAKLKKFIYDFFDRININEYIRPTIVDIIQYGNAGWILGFDNKGVNEIVPINIYSLEERMEFCAFEVEAEMKKSATFKRYSQYDRVGELIKSIQDKDNNTAYYKKFLLGYKLKDSIIPPWKFLHFRNLTTKSTFAPFGIPTFIHSMSAFRQYDASMGLQATARALRFPKEVYKLNVPNTVDPSEKLLKALEFLNALNNSGIGNSKKELAGLGDIIVTINDLYEYELKEANIDLGKIDDIQMLKDDLILSTFLPRNLLDPNDSSFGDSGISLVEKFKPFARFVYRFQKIFLEEITQLVKLHCIYSGEFEPNEIDFTLSMKYPESQTNGDIISSQNSLLDLANSIIDTIKDKITDGSPLPPEMVKDIYGQFLPYDNERIEKWIDDAIKSKEEAEQATEEENQEDSDFGNSEDSSFDTTEPEETDTELPSDENIEDKLDSFSGAFGEKRKRYRKYYLIEKKKGKRKIKEEIDNIVLEEKQKTMREYSYKKRHFYSSKNKNINFDANLLFEFEKRRLTKLKENEENEGEDSSFDTNDFEAFLIEEKKKD